ncbi:hypothetical protein M8J77_018249 [Diaphorina citri]|nr:hypothetical protein M8J77_018249 [Diaphorina citri]
MGLKSHILLEVTLLFIQNITDLDWEVDKHSCLGGSSLDSISSWRRRWSLVRCDAEDSEARLQQLEWF